MTSLLDQPTSIVFVGSSIMALWESLPRFFPEMPVLNTAVSGSQTREIYARLDELVLPHAVADAIVWLEEHHTRPCAALNGLSDGDLDELRLTNREEPWPTWRIFWMMAACSSLRQPQREPL